MQTVQSIVGKTVESVQRGIDDNGNKVVVIAFTDGTDITFVGNSIYHGFEFDNGSFK